MTTIDTNIITAYLGDVQIMGGIKTIDYIGDSWASSTIYNEWSALTNTDNHYFLDAYTTLKESNTTVGLNQFVGWQNSFSLIIFKEFDLTNYKLLNSAMTRSYGARFYATNTTLTQDTITINISDFVDKKSLGSGINANIDWTCYSCQYKIAFSNLKEVYAITNISTTASFKDGGYPYISQRGFKINNLNIFENYCIVDAVFFVADNSYTSYTAKTLTFTAVGK